MKGTRYKMNVDKLEICYKAPRETIDGLENTGFWEREGYRLQAIQSDNRIETILQIDILAPETESGYRLFGFLRLGNKFETEEDTFRYCWLRMANSALYTKGRCSGELQYIYWIQDDLGLQFNNVTEIEIAVDSNINWFKRVRESIRNNELVPVVLGKAYPREREVIKKLLYIHTADRIRYRTNSLSVKGRDMSLKLYNKSEEIQESGKDYISACFGSESCNIFRAEIRANNKAISDFAPLVGGSQYDVYMKLLDRNLLFDLFLFFSNRLIRFKRNRETISVLQL